VADADLLGAIEQSARDTRTFFRELSIRQERVFGAMIDHLNAQTAEIRELTAALREHRREFLEESRAQRAALFRMHDRLDGGNGPAAA
jgi:hypothetical protein